MQTKTKIGGAAGGLFALMALVTAVVAFIVFLMVALVALVGVASAVVAFLKRDTWTKPAYRWARDTSGRWSKTPWGPGDSGSPLEAVPSERVAS